MRTTGRARRGTRAATACRWRQRVVPRDAGHRGQRVRTRLRGRERGTFASRLVQFTITRVAVPDYGAELPLTSEEEGMLGWRQTGFSSQLLDRLADWQEAFEAGHHYDTGWRSPQLQDEWARQARELETAIR